MAVDTTFNWNQYQTDPTSRTMTNPLPTPETTVPTPAPGTPPPDVSVSMVPTPPGTPPPPAMGQPVDPNQWQQFTADLGVASDTNHTQINTLAQRLLQAGYQVQPGPIDSMGRQDSLVINGKLTRVFDSSGKWTPVVDVNGSAWGAPGSGGNLATGNLAYGLGSGANYGPWTAPWTGTWSAPTADQALNSPGVQFALQNSMRTLENSAAARGVLGNARVQEAISQDLGQQLLGNYQNIFNQALTSYQQNQADFFANQDRPWNKNFQAGQMGLSASQTPA